MSLNYTIHHDGETLRSVATGEEITHHDIQEYLFALADAAIKHKVRFVLCDESSLIHDIGITESYQLAEQIGQFAKFDIRVVIICNNYTYERAKFYENAAVNRGMMLRVFLNNEDAEQWLYSDQ